MDDLTAETSTINTNVPVSNWVDDLTKERGSHTLQFGANLRQVDNERASNAQSFFFAQTNVYWLGPSCIATCGVSLDPGAFGFPAVDSSFGASYDFAVTALTGLIPMVNSNYELTKTLSVIPEGSMVSRHFRAHESSSMDRINGVRRAISRSPMGCAIRYCSHLMKPTASKWLLPPACMTGLMTAAGLWLRASPMNR